MKKWANYVITAVKFKGEKRHILQLKRIEDLGEKLGLSEIVSRLQIVQEIEAGKTYVTAYLQQNGKWKRGEDVRVIVINNQKFIRTDDNGKDEDNLGNLPEFG